jgi:uncharacterized protein YxeA
VNCPQCGKAVNPGSSFCPYCGASLPASAPAGQNQAPTPPTGPPPPQGYVPSAPVPPISAPGAVPPPPRKKGIGRGWKIAIAVIVSVLVVFGALAAILGVFVFKTVKKPVDATNRYIEAINNGNAQTAWDLLSTDSPFKQEYDFSSFQSDIVDTNVGTLNTWNAHEVNISGSKADVSVDMTFTDGNKYEITFSLKEVNGTWLIYDYYMPSG